MALTPKVKYISGSVALSTTRTLYDLGIIDTAGANYLAYCIAAGTIANSTVVTVLKLQECDTIGGTYVDVPNAAFATTTAFSGTSISNKVAVFHVKLSNGRKRFIKALITNTGTPATTIDAVVGVLLENSVEPVNTAGTAVAGDYVVRL